MIVECTKPLLFCFVRVYFFLYVNYRAFFYLFVNLYITVSVALGVGGGNTWINVHCFIFACRYSSVDDDTNGFTLLGETGPLSLGTLGHKPKVIQQRLCSKKIKMAMYSKSCYVFINNHKMTRIPTSRNPVSILKQTLTCYLWICDWLYLEWLYCINKYNCSYCDF